MRSDGIPIVDRIDPNVLIRRDTLHKPPKVFLSTSHPILLRHLVKRRRVVSVIESAMSVSCISVKVFVVLHILESAHRKIGVFQLGGEAKDLPRVLSDIVLLLDIPDDSRQDRLAIEFMGPFGKPDPLRHSNGMRSGSGGHDIDDDFEVFRREFNGDGFVA